MEIFDGHRALLRPLVVPAIALGNFDGVHRGHQELLRRAVSRARAADGDAIAFTFDPHPAALLAPAGAPALLTPMPRRLELFDAAGVDVCIIEPFTAELAQRAPDDFARILIETIGARAVIVGYDFSYGHRRAGTPETLRAFGAARGVEVDIVAAVEVAGEVASSSRIRALLRDGDAAGAARLLGRPFDVDGIVVRGAGRGRGIGIPTANVRPLVPPPTALLPAPGVYAVAFDRLEPDPRGAAQPSRFRGVANLGSNPTFVDGGAQSLEVHLLDADADALGPNGHLYDQRVRVGFIERLRAEQRFADPDELVRQIRADIARAGEILGLAGA